MDMSTPQLVSLIFSGVTALLWFFLKNGISNITGRLDRIEAAISQMASSFAAMNVATQSNTKEIELLRERYHDLSNVVAQLKITQERCTHCNPR